MAGILIFGAGGHAKVVADILLSQGIEIAGFLDDNLETWRTRPLNIPVLGTTESYRDYQAAGAIIGIGANSVRMALANKLTALHAWINAIHPKAIIASSVLMGDGIVVAAGAIINPDSVIGNHVIINTGTTVDHDCHVDAFAHIAPGVHLGGGVRVGQGTLIGIGAIVHPYRTIGDNVTVGAGAVVIDDVPDNVTVVGIPARPLKER